MSSPNSPTPVTVNPQRAVKPGNVSRSALPPPARRKDDSGRESTWPFQSYLELSALPVAPSRARTHARTVLAEWGLTAIIDEADLVISELTTNAVQASERLQEHPPTIKLWLLSDAVRLVVVVWDASLQLPQVTDAPPDALNGRGLQIVAELSDDWGWSGRSEMAGKCVWSEIFATPEVNFLS